MRSNHCSRLVTNLYGNLVLGNLGWLSTHVDQVLQFVQRDLRLAVFQRRFNLVLALLFKFAQSFFKFARLTWVWRSFGAEFTGKSAYFLGNNTIHELFHLLTLQISACLRNDGVSQFNDLLVDLVANWKHFSFNLRGLSLYLSVDLNYLVHTLLYIFLIRQKLTNRVK